MSFITLLRCRNPSFIISRFKRSELRLLKNPYISKRDMSVSSCMNSSLMKHTLFEGKRDHYNSVTVLSSEEPCDNIEEFSKKLNASLQQWRKENVQGVMFKVETVHANWIPILNQHGFSIHHGRGTTITMQHWLPRDTPNKMPSYAHTMVGVGGIVMDKNNRILAICQKIRNSSIWKVPGGYVDPGEDIVEAVQREILEETNIQTEFISMVGFRHTLKGAFGCSDIYFVLELSPLTDHIIKQDDEVLDCQWMDINEFLSHPLTGPAIVFFMKKFLKSKKAGAKMTREQSFHPFTQSVQSIFNLSFEGETK